jgi:hypothetical protein
VPSIIPSYIYMFVAMLAVGTLLIFSFTSYATTLRSIPETEQLDNLLNHVAAKATQLLTTTTTNSNTQTNLNLPTRIGDREYWIRLRNDTLQSWIEGGFGKNWDGTTSHKVFLPGKPIATGHYISGFGPAVLKCPMNGSVLQLFLTSARDDTD